MLSAQTNLAGLAISIWVLLSLGMELTMGVTRYRDETNHKCGLFSSWAKVAKARAWFIKVGQSWSGTGPELALWSLIQQFGLQTSHIPLIWPRRLSIIDFKALRMKIQSSSSRKPEEVYCDIHKLAYVYTDHTVGTVKDITNKTPCLSYISWTIMATKSPQH